MTRTFRDDGIGIFAAFLTRNRKKTRKQDKSSLCSASLFLVFLSFSVYLEVELFKEVDLLDISMKKFVKLWLVTL